MLRVLQSSEVEGDLWELVGVHPHYFGSQVCVGHAWILQANEPLLNAFYVPTILQRVLAATKECVKLFGNWHRTLVPFLVVVTITIAIRGTNVKRVVGKLVVHPNSFVVRVFKSTASNDRRNEFLPLQLATIFAAVCLPRIALRACMPDSR